MLFRSPWAHARIRSIDVSQARGAVGVHAVVTGADVAQAGLGPVMPLVVLKGSNGENMHCSGMPILALDVVRHVGEPVALVVAETLELAMNAAERVSIDYDPLPCVTDLQSAVTPGAPLVQAAVPGNVAMDWSLGRSQALDDAFAGAHHVQEIELADPMLTGAPMEPKAALAQYDAATGRYTLVASTQGVKNIHHVLTTQVFKVPADRIRVLTPKVGGGFGLKSQTYPEQAALLLAAQLTGRPVKWTATRLE